MEIVLFITGFVGGLLGGMGLGGGTILIPMLTNFFQLSQFVAQGINIISFIPMAIISFFINIKNKLICLKDLPFFILPGIVFSFSASKLAQNLSNQTLKLCFSVFIIIAGIINFASALKKNTDY